MIRALITLFSLAAVGFLSAPAAFACNACPCTCNVDCALLTDLHCTDGQRVTLSSGADLDLNGHSITCDTPTGCSGAGVQVTYGATASLIKNTGAAGAGVYGPWAQAIDCGNNAGSLVKGLEIWGFSGGGISRCAKVEQNVIVGASGAFGFGVLSSGLGSTDYIRDNYVTNGISVIGPKSVSIRHNVLSDRAGAGTLAIVVDQAPAVVVEKNVIIQGDQTDVPIQGNSTATFAENYCNYSTQGCQSCIAQGYCADALSPFLFP